MTILHAGCGRRLNKVTMSGVLPWAQDRKGLPEGPFQLRPERVSGDEVGVGFGGYHPDGGEWQPLRTGSETDYGM